MVNLNIFKKLSRHIFHCNSDIAIFWKIPKSLSSTHKYTDKMYAYETWTLI